MRKVSRGENAQLRHLYEQMLSVTVVNIGATADSEEQLDGPQLLKKASEDLNHLIIAIQEQGPCDTGKECLVSVLSTLKEAGRMMFSKQKTEALTGMPETETSEDEV